MSTVAPGDLIVGTFDGYIEHRNGNTGAFIERVEGLGTWSIFGITVAPDGTIYAVSWLNGGKAATIQKISNTFVDEGDALAVNPFPPDTDAVGWDIKLHPSGDFLVLLGNLSGGATQSMEVWRVNAAGDVIQTWDLPSELPHADNNLAGGQLRMALACDGKTLYYTSYGHELKAYDLDTDAPLSDVATIATDGAYGSLALAPDGNIVVTEFRLDTPNTTYTDENGDLQRLYNGPYSSLTFVSADAYWTDEAFFHRFDGSNQDRLIRKRATTNGAVLATASMYDPDPMWDYALIPSCMAACYSPCPDIVATGRTRFWSTVMS